jgi:Tfp pilus assembly protein PilV
MHRKNTGQAIVEVVLAAGLVLVALTVLVAAVSRAVASNRLAKERVIATRLAQETVEWMNSQRSGSNWGAFCNPISAATKNEHYCASPADLQAAGADIRNLVDSKRGDADCDATEERSKTIYSVYVVFTENDCNTTDLVEFEAIVEWTSLGNQQDVVIHTNLTNL